MFASAKLLRRAGVMGINERNAGYTLFYNRRKFYPLVDDKLRTKHLAESAGLAVPKLHGVIEFQGQVRQAPDLIARLGEVAIKPAHGSGGEGILIIVGHARGHFRTVGGTLYSATELRYHLFNILSGMFSLGGQVDKVILEAVVHADPLFEAISYQGIPDIRIIVFLGVPVMAMVRLPTRMSGGKANLHQGAVGAGVDLATGTTTHAVWRGEPVQDHPDTGNAVAGLDIPGWEFVLTQAASCAGLTGLGYQGVDLVLDRDRGPVILEINARPGLAIQLANRAGLLARLDLVKKHAGELTDVNQWVAFARKHFGSQAPTSV